MNSSGWQFHFDETVPECQILAPSHHSLLQPACFLICACICSSLASAGLVWRARW